MADVHSIDVFSSGGGSDGPRRHLPACLTCGTAVGVITENYSAALVTASLHRYPEPDQPDGGGTQESPAVTHEPYVRLSRERVDGAYAVWANGVKVGYVERYAHSFGDRGQDKGWINDGNDEDVFGTRREAVADLMRQQD